ncbi:MAG: glycosyltransferase family 2 protein [Thermoprotei archaeon]
MVRRDVFEEVGGFDEDYFLLREETDLCWRMWLQGYKVIFIPNSVVYHAIGGAFKESNIQSLYFFQRNMIVTLIKNLEFKNLLKILPVHLLLLFIDSLFSSLKNKSPERLRITLKSINYAIRNLKQIWNKRLNVQSRRKVSDKKLFKYLMAKITLLDKLRERLRT